MKAVLFVVPLLLLVGCGGSPMSVETRDPNWVSPTSAQDAAQAERFRRKHREGNASPGNM
ncbi:hypothetical protein MesoLjLc_48290 [Mesorhizobium sp. L-8-10]|uniref:hypothetical protein n=1 Tax=Mesorhizobium sp. L-8-10 TaxID=2744523 RepID=UPI0019284AC9|nr:hypothetical protein [Mesorhizobium sp. L-8-10]BCH32899.1 hypothetical protein MesoLjLc_48290 [Mesorhizobium sp. L-8-10]